jgi:hypothetical protein
VTSDAMIWNLTLKSSIRLLVVQAIVAKIVNYDRRMLIVHVISLIMSRKSREGLRTESQNAEKFLERFSKMSLDTLRKS